MQTYRDGVGLERCLACGSAVGAANGGRLAPLHIDDVESMTLALIEVAKMLGAVTHILERAAGRNAAQIQAAKSGQDPAHRAPTEIEPLLPLVVDDADTTGGSDEVGRNRPAD